MAYLYLTRVWASASATTGLRLSLQRAQQLFDLSHARRVPASGRSPTPGRIILHVSPDEEVPELAQGDYELAESIDDPVVQEFLRGTSSAGS